MLYQCRIACLRIPKFQIVAHQKDEPGLKGKPFVITTGTTSRASVLMCSSEATCDRVFPGMKLSEARAVCADLLWREYEESLYEFKQREVLHRLVDVSPKVTSPETGMFFMDASGLAYMGGEEKFYRNILKVMTVLGFSGTHIGIADTAFTALVASRFKGRPYYIVPAGKSKEFLAPLSIKHLPDEMQSLCDTFIQLGIRTMGQLAEMSLREVEIRFGAEGLLACELARSNDRLRPQTVVEGKKIQCALDLGFPVGDLEQARFILKSMLERLCREMRVEGFLAESLLARFFNENNCVGTRSVKLLEPSHNPKFLLELLKLSLESRPLEREFTGINLEIPQFVPERWEQSKARIQRTPAAEVNVCPGAQATVSGLDCENLPRSAVERAGLLESGALSSQAALKSVERAEKGDCRVGKQLLLSTACNAQVDTECSRLVEPGTGLSPAFPFPSSGNGRHEGRGKNEGGDGNESGASKGRNGINESRHRYDRFGRHDNVDNDIVEQATNNSLSRFVVDSREDHQRESLVVLLQRLVSKLGSRSVVRAIPNDQHLPDLAGGWLPVSESGSGAVLPLNVYCSGDKVAPSTLACGLILRKSLSPEPVLVEYQGTLPTAITYQGRWFRIKELSEPERLSGLWWEKPVKKSYFIAMIEPYESAQPKEEQLERSHKQTSSSMPASGYSIKSERQVACSSYLVLLVFDHSLRCWQLEGFFD